MRQRTHNMMIKKTFLVPLSLMLAFNVQAATKSISQEVSNEINGQNVVQVEVQCDEKTGIYVIQQIAGAEQWCFSSSTNNCHATKLIAAQNICSDSSIKESESITPLTKDEAPVPVAQLTTAEDDEGDVSDDSEFLYDYDALRKEKMDLEDKRLVIQKEKLALKRREVELQKRQLNSK